jgi:hypothetical protein
MAVSEITETNVFSDQHANLFKMSTRLEYLNKFLPNWIQMRVQLSYAMMLAMVGIAMVFRSPLISLIAFAGAAYFYQMHKFNQWVAVGGAAKGRRLIGADL